MIPSVPPVGIRGMRNIKYGSAYIKFQDVKHIGHLHLIAYLRSRIYSFAFILCTYNEWWSYHSATTCPMGRTEYLKNINGLVCNVDGENDNNVLKIIHVNHFQCFMEYVRDHSRGIPAAFNNTGCTIRWLTEDILIHSTSVTVFW